MPNWGSHKLPLGVIGKNADTNAPLTFFHWQEIDFGDSNILQRLWDTGMMGTGPGKLNYDYIKGMATFSDRTLVTLEGAPECMLDKWDIKTTVAYTGFSAGGTGDSDELLNNPQDVTIGDGDIVYVLDILSNGQPRIKMFDEELNSLGGFGDGESIPGTPKRIDFDYTYGTVHVLTANDVVILEP
jgi:hypothetical protein